jgi:protein-S-isoprenylcysteine O-methyltransferase Ste14
MQKARENQMKIMPTTCLLVAILLCVALHFILPISNIVPSPWNLIGLIPFLLGIWINISADRAFKQANTTIKPFELSKALIQDGAFRLSRNPMYLGFIGILLGISILLRSITPYFVVIAFVILIELAYIRIEERMLAAKFGPEWDQYRSRVRKWI